MAALKTNISRRNTASSVSGAFENLDEQEVVTRQDRPTISEWGLVDIPLSIIKPFPGNRLLKLSNIDKLASSIQGTRLINPIAVAKDTDGMYYILSGHRRTEAYRLLNEQFPDGKYSSIPGYIVSSKDSNDPNYLKRIWLDANFETRQLSIEDGINNIELISEEIDNLTEEQKKSIIKELRGEEYSEEAYAKGSGKSRHLNKAKFIYSYFKHLDIPGWSESSIGNYLRLKNAGIPELKEAFLSSRLSLEVAIEICRFDKSEQLKLMNIFLLDPLKFESNKAALTNKEAKVKKDPFVMEAVALKRSVISLSKSISNVKLNKELLSEESLSAIKYIRQAIKTILNDIEKDMKELEEIARDV